MITAREPRLVISRRLSRRDHLHGAWWPRSSAIEKELAPMLTTVTTRFGVVLGVMLNREEWTGITPATQPTHAGRAKISWYGLTESHLAVLRCGEYRRIALLLLPPETPEDVALTATLMASSPGNVLTPQETLTRARADRQRS